MNDRNSNTTPGRNPKNQVRGGVVAEHPVGTGLGAAAAGAAAGAAGGAIAGPIGVVAGATVGAVVGGLAGHAVAEAVNPTVETKYWRESYPTRPYADPKLSYDEYGPAYRYGWESFDRHGNQGGSFDSVEADLGRGWDRAKGTSRLAWDQAKSATRDAWDRVKAAAHGRSTPNSH